MKNIETFTLNDWIDKAVTQISQKLAKEKKKVFLVLVAWWTSSWKTSAVAKKINDAFEDSQIISMDN